MQVYKVFFRILFKHKGQIIMYLGIFLGMAIIISNVRGDGNDNVFEASEYAFSVFDADDSEISREFVKYLEMDNKRVDISDNEESIQDELYNRNVKCVLRIPEGFGESVKQGELKKIELTSIPGSIYKMAFENMANNYVTLLKSYMAGGISEKEALKKTAAVCKKKAEVKLAENESAARSKMYNFYIYLPYIFISICVVGIGPVLIVFRRGDVKARQNCACYSNMRIQGELFAGIVSAGVFFCALFYLITLVNVGADVVSFRGMLNCLNMICFTVVTLGMTFLICQFIKEYTALSMVANIIGLGCSFLSGVFVPIELLGDEVIRVAHVLPSYWYVVAAGEIDGYHAGDSLNQMWLCMGVELLFGLAFAAAGIICSRLRMQRRSLA